MKTFAALLVTLALTGAARAGEPMSRGDHMRACAAQWKAQGHHGQGVRYQQFISACLKKMASAR